MVSRGKHWDTLSLLSASIWKFHFHFLLFHFDTFLAIFFPFLCLLSTPFHFQLEVSGQAAKKRFALFQRTGFRYRPFLLFVQLLPLIFFCHLFPCLANSKKL